MLTEQVFELAFILPELFLSLFDLLVHALHLSFKGQHMSEHQRLVVEEEEEREEEKEEEPIPASRETPPRRKA